MAYIEEKGILLTNMFTVDNPAVKLLELKEYIKNNLVKYLDDKHSYEEFCSAIQTTFSYAVDQGFYLTQLEINFYPYDLDLEATYLEKPDNWAYENIMGLLINLYSTLIGSNICIAKIVIEYGKDIRIDYREHPDYRYAAYDLNKVPADKSKWKNKG